MHLFEHCCCQRTGSKERYETYVKVKKFIFNNIRSVCWICITVAVVMTDKNIKWLPL
jgi:hypothetical protein